MIQRFINDQAPGWPAIEKPAELMYVCKADATDTRWPRAMHKHDEHIEIVLVTSGKGTHIVDGQEYRTQKGDLLIYNSGVLHDESAMLATEMAVYCCAFRGLKIRDVPANFLTRRHHTAMLATGALYPDLERLFEILYAQVDSSQPGAAELCRHLLQALIMLVLRLVKHDVPRIEAIPELGESVRNYIDRHYAEAINLATMAQSLKLSPYYLTRKFKDHTGQTPIQYLIRRRIGEAQSLLINNKSSIAEVALAVGYDDPNYFATVFKRVVGIPPSLYQRRYTE